MGRGPRPARTCAYIEEADLEALRKRVRNLVFDKTIATAGYAGNLSVWNLTDPKPSFTTKIKDVTYCVTFAPDGKTIVAGHEKGEVTVTKL